jgi:hypothetical protein
MTLATDTPVVVSNHLAVADLGDEAVILDPSSGNYFGLNEVAARILELAHEPTTVGQIVDRLLGEYNVSRDRLTADVATFVDELGRRGFLDVG